jgi:imidazolonepropionase-like amidohydrolase
MSADQADVPEGASGGNGPLLLAGARVITGDGTTVLVSADILVRDGLVAAVSVPGRLSATVARVVPLAGKTVIPAIINPHGHIGYMRGAATSPQNYSRDNILDHLRRLAYYGVSVFQSLGTDRHGTEIALRDEQRAGKLGDEDLAQLLTAGTGIVAPDPRGGNGGPAFAADVMHEAADADDARAYVRALAARHVDAVKFWVDDRDGTTAKLGPDVYTAIIDEAHAHGLKAAAHIYTLDDAKAVIRAGADILAHMPRHPGADDELTDLLISHGTAAFSSMSIQWPAGEAWLDDPALAETVSADAIAAMREQVRAKAPQPLFATVDVYRAMERTMASYLAAGVRVVFSADTGLLGQFPGFAEHRELEALVAAGMPPLQAIHAATQASARLLELDSARGTIETGKRADLLVLDGDPLVDIASTRRIHAVYLAGRRVDRDGLRARLLP